MDPVPRKKRRRSRRLSLWIAEEDMELVERTAYLRHESVNDLGNRGLMREVAKAGLLSREEVVALEVNPPEPTPQQAAARPAESRRLSSPGAIP